jgi:hypothetical protein
METLGRVSVWARMDLTAWVASGVRKGMWEMDCRYRLYSWLVRWADRNVAVVWRSGTSRFCSDNVRAVTIRFEAEIMHGGICTKNNFIALYLRQKDTIYGTYKPCSAAHLSTIIWRRNCPVPFLAFSFSVHAHFLCPGRRSPRAIPIPIVPPPVRHR